MPNGLHGLGRFEAAAWASYMGPDEWSPIDPESAVHDDAEGLSMDVVPESEPLGDRVLQALADDFRAEELQACSVD